MSAELLQQHWPLLVLALGLVALLAGFVDTLAGGGGMLTVPALTLLLSPELALGTNKLQSSCGTLTATLAFIRSGHIRTRQVGEALLPCALGAGLGVGLVQVLPQRWLAALIPALLIAIALLLVFMPRLGDQPRPARLSQRAFLLAVVLPLGFYDGFLGPGTGSFLLLALLTLRGRSLQQAAIEAKIYNLLTNLVALALFLARGQVVWSLGLAMALGQVLGARLASRLLLLRGNKLIRPMAITVSLLMSLVLAKRYWFS